MATQHIGGATAKAWLDSGASSLTADPATFPGGGSGGPYIANDDATAAATSGIFDAVDRDTIGGRNGSFGIGVDNPFGTGPHISSQPSEIGYYTDAIAGDQADTLDIKLDGALSNATAKVSFFYGAEESGEQLKYELYLDGVKVGEETISAEGNGAYSNSNDGFYTFALDGFTGDVKVFDEVKFIGAASDVADASDFLVESIDGTTAEGLSAGYWKSHTSDWGSVANNTDFSDIFGSDPFGAKDPNNDGSLTFQEVLGLKGGGEQALARQAVAAYLNINSTAIDAYPMTQPELVTEVKTALDGNNAADTLALTNELNTYNTLETTDWPVPAV